MRDHINEKNALTARGVAALLLAAMLSIANAGIPDPGITCFRQEGDALIASAGYNGYRSTDGGVSWGFDPGAHFPCDYSGDEEDWVEVEPAQAEAQAATRYRYRPNQEIQTSSDGGQTWQTAYSLTPTSEAEQQYYLRRRPGNTVFRPGPLDAIRDPRSGNVLFAMGHQGVLIHHSSGDWSWGMGGEYQHISVFPTADAFSLLLGGMLPLAVGALLLVFASLALRWTAKPLRITALAFGWAAFLLITILFPPVTANGYTQVATTIGMLGGAVMILPLSLEQSFQLGRINPTALPRLILFGLAAGLLFFLPYVLWLYNALPSLFLATGFALGLTLAVLAAGIFSVRKG